MPTIYLDFETHMTKDFKLAKMLFRDYIEQTHVTAIAWKEDDDPCEYRDPDDPDFTDALAYLLECAADPTYVFAAHNAAFDIRIITRNLHGQFPHTVDCSMELAMHVWPNQPGGYALANLGPLYSGLNKLEIDLTNCTREELIAYTIRDVEIGHALYSIELDRISPEELAVQRLTQQARSLELVVDPQRLQQMIAAYNAHINQQAEIVDEVAEESMTYEADGTVKSIRSVFMRDKLNEQFGVNLATTSLKKLNPAVLAQSADASRAVHAAAKANKALWHRRNAVKFSTASVVDVELGYARAHTHRFSSPQPGGKGINLHNIPKRDPTIAKPIRSTFILPEGWVWVSADLASVEYRWNGWQTDCAHTTNLYGPNYMADAYIAFWLAATGIQIQKSNPARHVAKGAVLGLGFLMGLTRWMEELMKTLADPSIRLNDQDLIDLCDSLNLREPTDRYVVDCMAKAHAPWYVAAIADYTHKLFHTVHPEFRKFASWLETVSVECSRALDPGARLDRLYAHPNAPSPDKVLITMDPHLEGRSFRVSCGGWPATLSWRDVKIRKVKGEPVLTSVRAGRRGYRQLTKNLLIENVTQAGARNAMVKAQLILEQRGYPKQFTVHDELKLCVPRDRDCIIQARRDLIEVLGPDNTLGFGWACTIDPEEIDISSNLYPWIPPAEWWDNPELGLIP